MSTRRTPSTSARRREDFSCKSTSSRRGSQSRAARVCRQDGWQRSMRRVATRITSTSRRASRRGTRLNNSLEKRWIFLLVVSVPLCLKEDCGSGRFWGWRIPRSLIAHARWTASLEHGLCSSWLSRTRVLRGASCIPFEDCVVPALSL